jgi:hypothetical protein
VKLADKMKTNGPVFKSVAEQLGPVIYGKEYRDCLGHAQNVLVKNFRDHYRSIQIDRLPPFDDSVISNKLYNMIQHARNRGIAVTIV